MKLRGGTWVSDNSDAEALAAALIASASVPIQADAAPTGLLRCARNNEQRVTEDGFESHPLELTTRFIKAVVR